MRDLCVLWLWGWLVGSLVKVVHMDIPWVRSGAQRKVWMTDPIKTHCCWQRWKSLMHEIIPMLINSTVCKCLCVCVYSTVGVCVRVKWAAREVDSRGEAALTSGRSRLRCCLVTRLNPEPPKQDLFKLFCFLFHPCNKNKIPQGKETRIAFISSTVYEM